MQTFIWVAGAHFLALLSPGPDFFLIAKSALASGHRRAFQVCLGIALANGALIAAAFTGFTWAAQTPWIATLIQGCGGGYLLYMGIQCWRYAGTTALTGANAATPQAPHDAQSSHGTPGLTAGLLSGLLNPKNALFYISLAAALGSPSLWQQWGYGLWMFSIVLIWDCAMALVIGHPRIIRQLGQRLPLIERLCGAMLAILGFGMWVTLVL